MTVLIHHIYEYKKGVRHLALHTLPASLRKEAEKKLEKQGISYVVKPINDMRINIFFGDDECVEVICRMGDKKLNEFTPEEDFILGIMLGYDKRQQCLRYLQQKEQKQISFRG
ncbi:MAG: DUF2023 family protein [Bacteroidales bacterium]|jgi:hypothetical protein|nr:DUF2023 family protein [Bacteroidales bacterium]